MHWGFGWCNSVSTSRKRHPKCESSAEHIQFGFGTNCEVFTAHVIQCVFQFVSRLPVAKWNSILFRCEHRRWQCKISMESDGIGTSHSVLKITFSSWFDICQKWLCSRHRILHEFGSLPTNSIIYSECSSEHKELALDEALNFRWNFAIFAAHQAWHETLKMMMWRNLVKTWKRVKSKLTWHRHWLRGT